MTAIDIRPKRQPISLWAALDDNKVPAQYRTQVSEAFHDYLAASPLWAAQLDTFDQIRGERDRARDLAADLEADNARLTARLWQLQLLYPHIHGWDECGGACLLCGKGWPCSEYAREVSEP